VLHRVKEGITELKKAHIAGIAPRHMWSNRVASLSGDGPNLTHDHNPTHGRSELRVAFRVSLLEHPQSSPKAYEPANTTINFTCSVIRRRSGLPGWSTTLMAFFRDQQRISWGVIRTALNYTQLKGHTSEATVFCHQISFLLGVQRQRHSSSESSKVCLNVFPDPETQTSSSKEET
jgi:hypothetical protein